MYVLLLFWNAEIATESKWGAVVWGEGTVAGGTLESLEVGGISSCSTNSSFAMAEGARPEDVCAAS